MCRVEVVFKTRKAFLEILISNSNCTNILGCSWFDALGIYLGGINETKSNLMDDLLYKYRDVFSEGLGTYTGKPISLPVNPEFQPIRMKARNVPLAMKPKIEKALDKLIREGVIEPIADPKWTTPVVPIIKPSGDVRLCGDYKVTLNKAMTPHPYPIPAVNHLLSNLKGGGVYAKIDLAQAYLQLPVDEKSAEAQTIITHKGAFKVKRLQFGINVAPGVFQNLIENLFQNLEGVVPYFDDVLVRASSMEELSSRLEKVLAKLSDYGLKANKEKCLFGVPEVEFLGYRIDKKGIHPSESKISAIKEFPIPKNKTQLQAFLGLLNFYNSFLKDKATIAEVLHRLLDNNSEWTWTKEHNEAFEILKNLLSSDSVLVPFDEKLPIVLACDASPFGVGAVLSHVLPDGQEAPIAFASRTLTSSERNYAQIDKEALGVIFGVKRFHHFLFGHEFTIITDHQPLLGIFNKNKPTKEIMSPRMLRWCLILNAYEYNLVHKPGKKIKHADALSRLPREIGDCQVPSPLEVLFTEELENPPLHATEIGKMTLRDQVLSRVLNFVLKGWPNIAPDKEFKIYFSKKNELSVHRNCLLWGNRVVIPAAGRYRVLQALHLGHPGIERMKGLARSYVWWPGMDADIDFFVKDCNNCQLTRHAPPRAPVHPWEITSKPWSRLHIDFAGPFQGQDFFILVDSFSKWVEVKRMPSTSAGATIDVLRDIFSSHGIPDVIVSDNGAQFTSSDFKSFLERNTIRQVLIAPRRPAANGQAERTVQTVKDSLRRIIQGSWRKRLANFLLQQHCTPTTGTGTSPAELLMGRKLRTILDNIHPDLTEERRSKQEKTYRKSCEDRGLRQFQVEDPVLLRNYNPGPRWIPATVVKVTGPVSYHVRTEDGQFKRCHVDQMLKRELQPPSPTFLEESTCPDLSRSQSLDKDPPVSTPTSADTTVPADTDVPPPVSDPDETTTTAPNVSPVSSRLRPRQDIRKPQRYPAPEYPEH